MPNKIKLLSVSSFVSPKDGKHYHIANAEIPAIVPGGWSTVRLSCVQDVPFPPSVKVGVEIPLVLVRFDAIRGTGSFKVG